MNASSHQMHEGHSHTHGEDCGHQTVEHEGHRDYLHDGHLHYVHGDCVDDHALLVGAGNLAECTPAHACGSHDAAHAHGEACGHPTVPHGDHVDHIVAGHLHFPHEGHCDEHGQVSMR